MCVYVYVSRDRLNNCTNVSRLMYVRNTTQSILKIPITRNIFAYNFQEENFTTSEKINSGQNG